MAFKKKPIRGRRKIRRERFGKIRYEGIKLNVEIPQLDGIVTNKATDLMIVWLKELYIFGYRFGLKENTS